MSAKRKVLVTGAGGFIGRHLLKLLLAEGHAVVALVRDAAQLDDFTGAPGLEPLIGDLLQPQTLARLPAQVDGVIHLAALLGDAGADETRLIAANLTLTERLLGWFSGSQAQRFVLVSTPGVQGLGHREASESAPYHPHGAYERTKMLAEQAVRQHPNRGDQSWTIVRPDFVYGPGDLRRLRLYRQIARRRWIQIGSGGAVVRPTYVSDVCRALRACLIDPRAAGEIFNVAGPDLVTVKEFVATIARHLGVKLWPLRLPTTIFRAAAPVFEGCACWTGATPLFTRSQVNFLTLDHGTDIRHIREQLGFEPIVPFDEGMRHTLAWARQAGLLPLAQGS